MNKYIMNYAYLSVNKFPNYVFLLKVIKELYLNLLD